MIITSEDKKTTDARNSASPAVQMGATALPITTQDLPPAYSDLSSNPGSSTPDASASKPLPPQPGPSAPRDRKTIKPTNYVSVIRSNHSIKDSFFIIDPTLQIPLSLLAPLAEGETDDTRKNLRVESKNGSIDIDVSVVAQKTEVKTKTRMVSMYVKCWNGSVSTKLHDADPSPSRPRYPVQLNCYVSNGSVSIQVPRSFQGPATIITHNGSTRLSESIDAHLTTFSEVANKRRCFIGDFSQYEEDSWEGDELIVEAKNGSVKLQFDDEFLERSTSRNIFAKLLGF